MFFKGACYRDVVRGDCVSENADHPWGWYEVSRVELVDEGRQVRLDFLGGGVLQAPSGTIIGLFRRQLPGGKTKERMLEDVAEAARRVHAVVHGLTIQDHLTDPDDALKALRELMDAYQLGTTDVHRG